MTGEIEYRPLGLWKGEESKNRRHAPFKTSFPRTLAKLEGEIRKLRATDAVIQVDVPPAQFRRDGRPYADAAWRSPRVALSMQTPYGALSYPCDTYDHWQDNVHAIALALEALRAVDRYGVTKRGSSTPDGRRCRRSRLRQ